MSYIIMYKSLTYAQRAARVLERVGIIVSISRAPHGLGGEGCAYCLKVSERRLSEALGMIRSFSLNSGKVYKIDAYGNYTEVFI